MIEDKITLKGRLRAYDEDGNKIFDKKNRILDDGLNYIVYILAAEYDGTEDWYNTTDGEEYAVESIVIGDDNTPHYEIEEPIEDIQGNFVNEGLVQREDEGYELIDTGHFSFVFEVENDSETESEEHYEAVITNNYDSSEAERLCMSRITFEEPVSIGPEQTILYIWDLVMKRGV